MKKNNLHIKKTGFTTPNNYFENFEDRLFEKLAEENIPKTTGFQVPETYFDGLEDSLSATLFDRTEDVKVISIQRKKNFTKYIRYAAAACVAIFAGILLYMNFSTPVTMDNIVNSEINTFIENDLIALNNYEIVDVYEEENIDISTIFEVELDESETIDYLEKTTDPYEYLIE